LCAVDAARSLLPKISVGKLTSLSRAQTNDLFSDDLTVEVIFFGNGEKSGDVVVNKEASASASNVQAKL
jgi:hypothetical protein